MGWSCGIKASEVLNKWMDACLEQSGSQNQFTSNGNTYFFEHSRKEHDDGAITGSIWKFLPDGVHVRKSGTFRIERDGSMRAPKWLKDAAIAKTV